MENITIGKTVSIRSKGFNEAWLQDRICETPSILNLGDLELLYKEKPQNGGGRLDILLKEPISNAMYEVEVMLGETDESHIIRTIEYWDREKRKYPKRSHTAVLVAEVINKRFFDVIHLFSHAIPIIAIQVKMIDANNVPVLFFNTILNTYEEPEDTEMPQEEYDENQWLQISKSTVEAAKTLSDILRASFPDVRLHYVQSYIAILINGKRLIKLRKRESGKPQVKVWLNKEKFKQAREVIASDSDAGKCKLETTNDDNHLWFYADAKALRDHAELMLKLTQMVKDSWEN